jgi:hypothetical protein
VSKVLPTPDSEVKFNHAKHKWHKNKNSYPSSDFCT